MPADFHRVRYIFPKFSKSSYAVLMRTLHNSLTFDLSNAAKFRLHVLSFYAKHGWKATIDAFGISRGTLYNWRKAFYQSNRCLSSLIPQSTRPKNLRQMATDWRLVEFIKAMREAYGNISKYKLKPFLNAYAQEQGINTISISTIGKVLKRKRYFFDRSKVQRKRKKPLTTYRRYAPKERLPGYLEMDTVHIWVIERRYYFATIIDVVTRFAWCSLVPSLTAKHSLSSLKKFQKGYSCPIRTVQTDNGSEFLGIFHQYLVDNNINHEFIYPRSPRINGIVERFNRTIQEEFIRRYDNLLLEPIKFQEKLAKYLTWYNAKRPHWALNMQPPLVYLKKFGADFPISR